MAESDFWENFFPAKNVGNMPEIAVFANFEWFFRVTILTSLHIRDVRFTRFCRCYNIGVYGSYFGCSWEVCSFELFFQLTELLQVCFSDTFNESSVPAASVHSSPSKFWFTFNRIKILYQPKHSKYKGENKFRISASSLSKGSRHFRIYTR